MLPVPQPQFGERPQDIPLLTTCKAVNKHLVMGLGNREAGVLVIVCRTAGHIPVLPNLPEPFESCEVIYGFAKTGFLLATKLQRSLCS